MKYLNLIRVNITRKKTRLLLTIGSFAVALFLFGLLVTIHNAFYQGIEVAGADRLLTISKTSLIVLLPESQMEKIKQVKGVSMVTSSNWFGGIYQDKKNFFPQFAIDVETYRKVFPEFLVKEEHWATFLKDRQGCIVGRDIAERFGWKVGDRVPLQGTIVPGTWEFNVCGIYDGAEKATDVTQFWFHYKLLEEKTSWLRGQRGWYTIKIDNPDDAPEICKTIDNMFANSPNETKTKPEALFAAGFIKQFGNIKLILFSVGGVVFFTLLLVAGSTMAMSVRERTKELAVLKTLGYTNKLVLVLILSESITYAFLGGGLGILLAKVFTMGGDPTGGMLPFFYFSPMNIIVGLMVTLVIGFFSGLVPALDAMHLRIVEALRRI